MRNQSLVKRASRPLLVLVAAGSLALTPALPARANQPAASTVRVEQYAPVPCVVACPYWEPTPELPPDICNTPTPPGSFDKTVFEVTDPTRVVVVEAWSSIDYDSFVCTDTEPSVLVKPFEIWWGCPSPFIPVFDVYLGAGEGVEFMLERLHRANGGANDRFVVISYNWSDVESLPVVAKGPVALVDDSFDATAVPTLPAPAADQLGTMRAADVQMPVGRPEQMPSPSRASCITAQAIVPERPDRRSVR